MWHTLSKALKDYGYNERTGASTIQLLNIVVVTINSQLNVTSQH